MNRRFAWLALISSIVLSLESIGCGSADRPAEAPSGGAAAAYTRGPNDSRIRESNATSNRRSEERDRDGDGVLDMKDAPAPPPDMGAKAAPPQPPPPPPNPSPNTQQPNNPLAPHDAAEEAKRDTQLIIYTAKVTMAVYQVDTGLGAVEKIARDMGGYLSLKRDREITIRIPRARFEPALAAIDKIGDVVHRDIQAQDVTDEFVDTEIRIKNAKAMQTRLRALLERAAVKEAIEIEKELARVTQELELYEGRLKMLKDKIAYSTITVTFEARGSSIQATRIRLPFPWLSQLGLPNLLTLDEVK